MACLPPFPCPTCLQWGSAAVVDAEKHSRGNNNLLPLPCSLLAQQMPGPLLCVSEMNDQQSPQRAYIAPPAPQPPTGSPSSPAMLEVGEGEISDRCAVGQLTDPNTCVCVCQCVSILLAWAGEGVGRDRSILKVISRPPLRGLSPPPCSLH